MKKYLIFTLMFCSASVFAQISCVIPPENIEKIVLKHTGTNNTEVQSGTIYLKNKTTIKIYDYSSWCNCVLGETLVFKDLVKDMPDNCSICLYQKTTNNGDLCGCKCVNRLGSFSCYRADY